MCSIAGIKLVRQVLLQPNPQTDGSLMVPISANWKSRFVKLMCDIETSGYRATGLTLVKVNGKISTLKHDTNATKFFDREDVQKTMEEDYQTIVGHCRFPTKGDAQFPRNNHPFTYGNTTIVHQGILSNDEELKTKYGFTPEGETDSWIIVHLIEKYRDEGKSVIDAIAAAHEELKGSWGVVLVDALEPEKLYLFCHNREFKVNYYPEEKMFMFCTEDKKLDKYNLDISYYFKYFQQLKSLEVAELRIGNEECLVLGGEEEVEFYTLPEPQPEYQYDWQKKNKDRKFGDGWGYETNDEKRAKYLLEDGKSLKVGGAKNKKQYIVA